MRFQLTVKDQPLFGLSVLYEYDLPDLAVWLPEGAAVTVPTGDDSGLECDVWRCLVDLAEGVVVADLGAYVIDPPESYRLPRSESRWDSAEDGDLHAQLLDGGWRRYKSKALSD